MLAAMNVKNILHCGMWHRVILQIFTDVLEVPAASLFIVVMFRTAQSRRHFPILRCPSVKVVCQKVRDGLASRNL
jgi:hypothetical protein